MNRTIFAGALVALTLAAAAPAFAGELKIEARDVTNQGTPGGSAELKLDYKNDLVGRFDYSVELSARQADNTGNLRSSAVGRVQTDFSAPLGFTVTPRVELGASVGNGNNFALWGVEVTAVRQIYGPVSLNLGVRHREGFDDADLNDNRTAVGLEYALGADRALGLTFYNTNGLVDSSAVGVSYKTKF
jgi:hypothetical protein